MAIYDRIEPYFGPIPESAKGRISRPKEMRAPAKRKRLFPADWKPRPYTAKQFIAWDGEGINQPDRWQRYVVFGNSMGDYISAHDLRTLECLELLLGSAATYPNAINVIFGGDYDVNMILRDVPPLVLRNLHKNGEVWNWKGYHITYIPHKIFSVWRHKSWGGRGKSVQFVWYDVFTFFSCSFVKALKLYEAVDENTISVIESGKSLRGDFSDAMVHQTIIPYWQKELVALVSLCEKLEISLCNASIDLDSYHGPGAVADFVLKKFYTKLELPHYETEPELQNAIQSAYAGGRFELFKMGRMEGPIYKYDIRSAYPHAIRKLPSLNGAYWTHHEGPPKDILPWSLYKLTEWRDGQVYMEHGANPYFYRTSKGNIIYPVDFKGGWHYGIEIRHQDIPYISEYWELHHSDSTPFVWVEDLYQQRANWRMEGNPAEKAAKLSINSLYGKFAQRIGAKGGPPKWHVLEWAGMITAHCRAQLFDAIMQAPQAIIACETDSVFSTEPLDLMISTELGSWELEVLDEILYLQSGLYWSNGAEHPNHNAKFRGLAPGAITYDKACRYLENGFKDKEVLETSVHRFRTMGSSLIQYYDDWPGKWCQWEDIPKRINPNALEGKRIHTHCELCKNGRGMLNEMHPLAVNLYMNTHTDDSMPHKLEWIDGEGINGPEQDFEMV